MRVRRPGEACLSVGLIARAVDFAAAAALNQSCPSGLSCRRETGWGPRMVAGRPVRALVDSLERSSAGESSRPPRAVASRPTATRPCTGGPLATWDTSPTTPVPAPGHRGYRDRSQSLRGRKVETGVGFTTTRKRGRRPTRLAYVEIHNTTRKAAPSRFLARASCYFARARHHR